MSDNSRIALIILAAGRSTRMGEHKLLLTLNGRPLITYALLAAMESGAQNIIVVLGHDADAVRDALPEGTWRAVVCGDYGTGMSASLRAGLRAVEDDATGAVILLGDQPLITPAHLRAILARAATTPDRIIATQSQGRPSTPVYFPRALFGELMGVTGDEGGRSVVARHRDLLQVVGPYDDDEMLDVDDPESLRRARAALERRR